MAEPAAPVAATTRGPLAAVAAVAIAILAAGLVAAFFVVRHADDERARALTAWEGRLGLVAETRAAAISAWLARQYDELGGIADNEALQLYAATMIEGSREPRRVAEAMAYADYLKNLLAVVAERAGFHGRPTGADANANVRRVGVAGLALVDLAGQVVVATDGMPPVAGPLGEFLASSPRGRRALHDIHKGAAGTPSIAFAVPLLVASGGDAPARQIGWVLGVKEVARELYPLLDQPGAPWQTAEALLVRRAGAAIEYLASSQEGRAALERALAFEPDRLAAAFATANPGGFAIRRDWRAEEVLVTGRAIAGAPWTVVYKIDRAEALGADDARVRRQVATLLGVIALLVLATLLVWRHGASRRAAAAAGAYRTLAGRYEAQTRLLRLVTNSQPNAIVIVGDDGRVRFANETAAKRVDMDGEAMIGKPLANVIGAAAASRIERFNETARRTGATATDVRRTGANGDLRVAIARHVPVPTGVDHGAGVLVVEEDITDAVAERERSERTLERLVATLVTLLDRRDPYSAHHSERTAEVARALARELDLDPVDEDAVATAARLMNIGKILVPSGLLTRVGTLDAHELRRVRESIQAGADLLEDVEFDGPVVEIMRQMHERWDGGGEPKGLRGEEILIGARIAAVANAFVAMTSPRAWRGGMSFDEAMKTLNSMTGSAYDRRVVVALCHLIENRGAREAWRAEPGHAVM